MLVLVKPVKGRYATKIGLWADAPVGFLIYSPASLTAFARSLAVLLSITKLNLTEVGVTR